MAGQPSTAPGYRAPRATPRGSQGRSTPFQLVDGTSSVRRSTKQLLLAITRVLEQQAEQIGECAVVLSTFQHDRHLTAGTLRRYEQLASTATLVGMFGAEVDAQPAAGVRGVRLDRADPLSDEWDVVVVGPHFAAALLARDVGDTGPDPERRFDYRVSYDRDLVVEAARRLLRRMGRVDAPPPVAG